jgi:hypothetical protein
MPTLEVKYWKWLLNLLKVLTVTVPLILAGLVRIAGLDGWSAVHLTSNVCFLSFVIFICSARTQPAVKSKRRTISDYSFALIALSWIFILEIILPSLARSKY